jgi:SAM-dependent methyltransferase
MEQNINPHNYRIKYSNEDVKIFKENNCNTLLEIFFGDGRNMINFKKDGFEVTGIDDGEQKKEKYENIPQLKEQGFNLFVQPIFDAKLPFNDNQFDGVYAWHYINHNYKEIIIELFKEIFRILKPNGIFSLRFTKHENLIFDKSEYNVGDIVQMLPTKEELNHGFKPESFKVLAKQTFESLEGKEKGIPHYSYRKEELIKDLEELGFKVIKIEGILWNWHIWCEK